MNNNQVTNKLLLEMMCKRFDRLEDSFDNHCINADKAMEKLGEGIQENKGAIKELKNAVRLGAAVLTALATAGYDFVKSRFFK